MTRSLHDQLIHDRVASRIWHRDPSVFRAADDPTVRAAVLNRLGWLDAPVTMRAALGSIDAVVAGARRDGLTHTCLLGMGGSSLCAEVLRHTGAAPGEADRFLVLDTTDERAVRAAAATLDPRHTLFLVASKSGTTIEVIALEAFFRDWVTQRLGDAAGRHFIAITDPDTALVTHAATHGYRHTFANPADIGGRFSALSLFGLVPAALLGLTPAALLDAAGTMAAACRSDDEDNPGLALGAFMADHARLGRDKLTILLPPPLATLGLWIEQLVAESTGKLGRGVLPVVDEPVGAPDGGLDDYGHDRAFVLVSDPDDDSAIPRRVALAAAGHPVLHLQSTPRDLGAEFFRWEFATAVAGLALDVNPFDEPNVREAKARTQALLDTPGPLRVEPPLVARDGVRGRSFRPDAPNPAGGFVAILDYLPADDRRPAVVTRVRQVIRRQARAATTYGTGPRYLHSTGQFHKGGTNAGVFLLLTAGDATTTPVPGAAYSFSLLKHAQALGDFDALCANGRHVIHFHIDDPSADFSAELERLLTQSLG